MESDADPDAAATDGANPSLHGADPAGELPSSTASPPRNPSLLHNLSPAQQIPGELPDSGVLALPTEVPEAFWDWSSPTRAEVAPSVLPEVIVLSLTSPSFFNFNVIIILDYYC